MPGEETPTGAAIVGSAHTTQVPAGEPAAPAGGKRSLVSVVASLTSVNVLVRSFALITGPLTARALAPAGRGELAAILVPFTLAPWIIGIGLPTYAGWKAASSRSLGAVVGSVCALSVGLGLIGVAVAAPLASFLAEGRDVVYTFLLISFLVMPLLLCGNALQAIANGLAMWRVVIVTRLLPPLIGITGIVVLFVTDALTVASAAAVTLGGALVALAPLLSVLRRAGRLRFRRELAREALNFGAKAWAGTVAQLANYRLDQLIMIPLVNSSQLGLYAVAVSLAGATGVVSGAISPALLPRIAGGDKEIVGKSTRFTLALIVVSNVVVGAATPWLLPALFGSKFHAAVPMTMILLVGAVPSVGSTLLGAALTNAGQPGPSAKAQLLALGVTIPGLFLLLPPLGGVGAAWVSLTAYSLSFGFLLAVAMRHFQGTLQDFLLVRAPDIAWARSVLGRGWRERRRVEA